MWTYNCDSMEWLTLGTDSLWGIPFFFCIPMYVVMHFMKEGLFDNRKQCYRNGIRQNL